MANLQTDYQCLLSCSDNEDTPPETDVIFHVAPESGKSRWNHIVDLDSFFRNVYQYHQRHGFRCIVLDEFFIVFGFTLTITFSVFALHCVDYQLNNREIHQNETSVRKESLPDFVIPLSQCSQSFSKLTWCFIIFTAVYCTYLTINALRSIVSFNEIRMFYNSALKISSDELNNITWHEVQCRLREVQHEQQMCVHKQELTDLDIYHRILRHDNYMIAMVNKNILPLKHCTAYYGEFHFFSADLKYIIEVLLFRSPLSLFKSTWQLKDDYKNYNKRKELADRLSKIICVAGACNFFLSPFKCIWNLFNMCFEYAGYIRREPSYFGYRCWSQYAILYLRHFNELDHELKARLSRAYKPSCRYMNSFPTYFIAIIARFFSSSLGFCALYFCVWIMCNDRMLQVDNVTLIVPVATVTSYVLMKLVPDENEVYMPDLLMKRILADIHYIPDSWKCKAHTMTVQKEFSRLFQMQISKICVELISPFVTTFVLICSLRHRSLDIVDFFRSFTVDVAGVGDVCSFALMDVLKHGNHYWCNETKTESDQYHQAENGKTELSLVHFTMTNPTWNPPPSSNAFITNLKDAAQCDAEMIRETQNDNALCSSIHSLISFGPDYEALVNNITYSLQYPHSNRAFNQSMYVSRATPSSPDCVPKPNGAVSHTEGPLFASQVGILSSLQENGSMQQIASEMSLSTLYLHELHDRKLYSQQSMQHTQISIQQDNEENAGNELLPFLSDPRKTK